jgi:serine/threonine protein phosphatase PrpC
MNPGVLLCLVRESIFYLAWAGDCRAILSRTPNEVQQLTADHVPEHPKERERLNRADVPVKNGRLFGVLAPSRAFGDCAQKDMNPLGLISECEVVTYSPLFSGELGQFVDSKEELGEGLLDCESFILMATDGIWSAMKNMRASSLLRAAFDDTLKYRKQNDCTTREEFSVKEICKRGSMLGGDDSSAVVIFFRAESDSVL